MGYPRSTIDLDFTSTGLDDDDEMIRAIVEASLTSSQGDCGVKCRVSSIRRQPPRPESTLPTFIVKIAYAFPGDRYFAEFRERPNWSVVLPIEISFNDLVCETVRVWFGDKDAFVIELCTLNDIVAEKLRAILQQVIRNRTRPQDVYDFARAVREDSDQLDAVKVGDYLRRKCEIRNIAVDIAMYDVEAKARSSYGYEQLERDLGHAFIPFEQAWAEVISLVERALRVSDEWNQSPPV